MEFLVILVLLFYLRFRSRNSYYFPATTIYRNFSRESFLYLRLQRSYHELFSSFHCSNSILKSPFLLPYCLYDSSNNEGLPITTNKSRFDRPPSLEKRFPERRLPAADALARNSDNNRVLAWPATLISSVMGLRATSVVACATHLSHSSFLIIDIVSRPPRKRNENNDLRRREASWLRRPVNRVDK